jgi:hypothetical protein
MSYTETPTNTLRKFDANENWRSSSIDVLAADFLSINCEANLFLNPAFYEERSGKLWDPVRKMHVAGTANGDEIEENIIHQLEDWFITHDSGIAVWISPRKEPSKNHPGYPEEQITIYRIAYRLDPNNLLKSPKILFYTSHQFNKKFNNPEEIRKVIFPEEDSEQAIFDILSWLKKVSQKDVQTKIVDLKERQKNAEYFAYQYRSGIPMDRIIREMRQTNFLGNNPIGCGASNINYSTNNLSYSEARYLNPNIGESGDGLGPREFKCPTCGYTNIRPFGGLVHRCQNPNCPHPEAVMC